MQRSCAVSDIAGRVCVVTCQHLYHPIQVLEDSANENGREYLTPICYMTVTTAV